jgi:hypothetical protein
MNLTRHLAAAALALLASAAQAQMPQITDAMIQQRMAAMNANIARGQGMVQQIVQQRMQDPAVQAAWQQYLAQTGGRPAMDYPTFTYYYVYTAGFSTQGKAHMAATERGIQQREMAAWQGVRQAEQQRAAAQQAQRDGYFANQQEAGRGLMGQSTYYAPNGAAMQLPHTWQRNQTYTHQGNTYHVDASGTYHVLAANGWWYPLQPR